MSESESDSKKGSSITNSAQSGKINSGGDAIKATFIGGTWGVGGSFNGCNGFDGGVVGGCNGGGGYDGDDGDRCDGCECGEVDGDIAHGLGEVLITRVVRRRRFSRDVDCGGGLGGWYDFMLTGKFFFLFPEEKIWVAVGGDI